MQFDEISLKYCKLSIFSSDYWRPFALEYKTRRVDCGLSNLKRTLYKYGYVIDYNRSDLDLTIGKYFTSELKMASMGVPKKRPQRPEASRAFTVVNAALGVPKKRPERPGASRASTVVMGVEPIFTSQMTACGRFLVRT